MRKTASSIMAATAFAVVVTFVLANNFSTKGVKGAQRNKKMNTVASSENGSAPQGESTKQVIKHVRITGRDIARVSRGKNYLVDLTRRNTIYHFDPTSRAIEYSRIKIRTKTGEYNLETWLEKRLPGTVGSKWKSRPLRIGLASVLGGRKHGQPGSSQIQAYTTDGGVCHCTGDNDCNNMFSDDVCIDEGVCFDDDPERPECFCICAK